MSKDEAWEEVKGAWYSVCQEFCDFGCQCDEKLQEVKEALNV